MTVTACPRQIRISGGSSETDVKLLTVSPCGVPLAVHHAGDRDTRGETPAGPPEFLAGDRRAAARIPLA